MPIIRYIDWHKRNPRCGTPQLKPDRKHLKMPPISEWTHDNDDLYFPKQANFKGNDSYDVMGRPVVPRLPGTHTYVYICHIYARTYIHSYIHTRWNTSAKVWWWSIRRCLTCCIQYGVWLKIPSTRWWKWLLQQVCMNMYGYVWICMRVHACKYNYM